MNLGPAPAVEPRPVPTDQARLAPLVRRPPLRRRAVYAGQALLQWSGLARGYLRLHPVCGAVILIYHSIVPPATARWLDPATTLAPARFEAQMRFLRRRRQVVSLSDLVDALAAGREPAPGTVAITFDDGYRDTLEHAAPILERYGLPATLYLPTGYINRGQTQWVDCLHTMFTTPTRPRLDLRAVLGADTALPPPCDLRQPTAAAAAYQALRRHLISALEPQRQRVLAAVAAQVRPAAAPPRLTLTWDEVRRLLQHYPRWEIGVHTVDHLDLGPAYAERAAPEIAASIADVRRELGQTPEHGSYPYGRWCPPTRAAAQATGMRSMTTTEPQLATLRSDPFTLGRIGAPPAPGLFAFYTSGAYPDLSQALLRRV